MDPELTRRGHSSCGCIALIWSGTYQRYKPVLEPFCLFRLSGQNKNSLVSGAIRNEHCPSSNHGNSEPVGQ